VVSATWTKIVGVDATPYVDEVSEYGSKGIQKLRLGVEWHFTELVLDIARCV
jgi:hypothetical protein